MNKSSFGTHFTVTTWGESHGKALGAVVDGCPAGLSLCEEDIQKFLDRRKPGQSRYTTARKEGDLVEILSGQHFFLLFIHNLFPPAIYLNALPHPQQSILISSYK